MGGFAFHLDAIVFAVVGRSQFIQLLCQVILPAPGVENRVGNSVEG